MPSYAEADLQPICFTITSCVAPAAPEITFCEMRAPSTPGIRLGAARGVRGEERGMSHMHTCRGVGGCIPPAAGLCWH